MFCSTKSDDLICSHWEYPSKWGSNANNNAFSIILILGFVIVIGRVSPLAFGRCFRFLKGNLKEPSFSFWLVVINHASLIPESVISSALFAAIPGLLFKRYQALFKESTDVALSKKPLSFFNHFPILTLSNANTLLL